MADEDAVAEAHTCPPCRGTGTVVSHLGGQARPVTCPWCDGTGALSPGHDAQARWRERGEDPDHDDAA
jgi:DnaJ-class molecular chaperone